MQSRPTCCTTACCGTCLAPTTPLTSTGTSSSTRWCARPGRSGARTGLTRDVVCGYKRATAACKRTHPLNQQRPPPPPLNACRSTNPRESRSGLFAHPPHPRSFKTQGAELLRDLMSIEVPVTLNAAFCERHRRVCPPSDELDRECSKVGGWEWGKGGGVGGRWGGDGWSTLLWIYFVWLGAGSKDACGLGLAGGALPAAATAALSPPFNPAPRPLRCFSCRGLQAEQMLRDFDEAYKELEQQLPDPCRDTGARVCMAACRSRRSSSACQAAGHTCRPGLACPALHPAHTASPSPLPRPPTPHPHTPHPTPHTPSADVRCPQWAKAGECEKNQGFMFDSCMLSCNVSWGTAQHSVQAVGDLRGAACVRTRPCHPSPPAPACACVPCLSASHLADRPPPPSPPPAPAAAALRAPGRAGCHRRSSWGRCRRTGRRHDWRRSKGQCGASRHRSTAAC